MLLKDGMGVKDGKFEYYVGSLKGGHKKYIYIGWNCLKRGLGQFADLREGQKRGQCTLCRLLALTWLGFATLHSLN